MSHHILAGPGIVLATSNGSDTSDMLHIWARPDPRVHHANANPLTTALRVALHAYDLVPPAERACLGQGWQVDREIVLRKFLPPGPKAALGFQHQQARAPQGRIVGEGTSPLAPVSHSSRVPVFRPATLANTNMVLTPRFDDNVPWHPLPQQALHIASLALNMHEPSWSPCRCGIM